MMCVEEPKIGCEEEHVGHTKDDMFEMRPSSGTETFWKRFTPLIASFKARSCGVEIMMAPIRG